VPKLRDVGYDPSSFQFYDQTEVAALLRATEDEQDRAIFLTAATSGLRLGELIALRVRDVDFAGEVIRVSRSYGHQVGGVVSPKNGKGRSVPLIPQTAAALARLLQRSNFVSDDDLIFVRPTGGFLDRSALRRRYKHAQAEVHLRPIRFHDLRHSFATAVAAAGSVPIRELQELLGHSSLAMTLRYSHFSPKPDAAKRLAGAFAVEEPQPAEPELLAGQPSS
jgi:integrase